MSWKHLDWATEQKTGSSTRKIVLLMLADRTNKDTGKCRPSIKCIAKDCELSESAVKDALRALIEMGLVRSEQRFHEGVNLPNEYELVAGVVGQQETQGGAPENPGVGRQETQGGAPGSYKPVNEPVIKPEQQPPNPQGGKRVRVPFDPGSFDSLIPLHFQTLDFVAAWQGWVADRKERKQVMTEQAAKLALERLAREARTPELAISWIKNAIEKGWRGIYQPSNIPSRVPPKSGRQQADDSFITQLEEMEQKGVPSC